VPVLNFREGNILMTAVLETTYDPAVLTEQATDAPTSTVVVNLDPAVVAQHPDNIRDAGRDIDALAGSMREVGVLVPLIVVPVALVTGHEFPATITHVAIDGNRRVAAAHIAGVKLPCLIRTDLAAAKATTLTMAVTALARDGLTPTEESHAIAALFEAKFSGAAIHRATGRSRDHLAAARTAATLTHTTQHLTDQYPLT